MVDIIEGAGLFIYPLGLCSLAAVFIIVERAFALRRSRVVPTGVHDSFVRGEVPDESDTDTVVGRILRYYYDRRPDTEQLKAFARLQINQMERGLFVLDIVIAASPLLGLLGTVTGLIKVFARISPETGMPDPGVFVQGVSLALTTTMIGLAIAIPALVANSWLNRRIDSFAAELNVGLERLVQLDQDRSKRDDQGLRRGGQRQPTV